MCPRTDSRAIAAKADRGRYWPDGWTPAGDLGEVAAVTLRRARRDRWILGVCGGIAHTYGTSPTGVRLLTVLLAIIIPGCSVVPTFLVYLGLGVILPASDEF